MSKPVIVITGRLSKDLETVGKGGTKLSIPCDVGTAKKPKTDWYNIVVWEDMPILKYLKKGSSLIITGEQEINKVEGKDTYVNVTARLIQFGLSSGANKEATAPVAKVEAEPELEI